MVNMDPNIDVSLNEIILKNKKVQPAKKVKLVRKQGQINRVQTGGVYKAKTQIQAPGMNSTARVGDVRNLLIQQKRNKLTDAREQLAKIAKTGDVRDKLNKIRGSVKAVQKQPTDMRQKLNMKKLNTIVQNVAGNQQRKMLTQNQIASGKVHLKGNALVRTINSGAAQPVQKNVAPVTRTIAGTKQTMNNRFTATAGRQQNNMFLMNTNQQRANTLTRAPAAVSNTPVRTIVASAARTSRQPLRQSVVQQARPAQVRRNNPPQQKTVYVTQQPQPQTVYRQMAPAPRTQYIIEEEYAPPAPTVVYRQARRPAPRPTIIYTEEAPQYDSYDQPEYIDDQLDSYYQEEEEAHLVPQEVYVPPPARPQMPIRQPRYQQQPRYQPQQPRYQPQQPRYQQQQPQPRYQQQSYGPPAPQQRFANSSPYVPRPARQQQAVKRVSNQTPLVREAPKVVGHKVSVSNLHAATRDDIQELFGNIGQISSCNMIRSDTAVVVFDNYADAKKSVDVYHNRKLDNQPMIVKIIGTVNENTPIRGANKARLM